MRVSHMIHADFDDPNLVSAGGLVPTMALAQRAGLSQLAAEHLTVAGSAGANAHVKVPALVAGMVAGADSIEDMDLLRHGAMDRLFVGLRAPTTLGTHLRAYTFGHVRQLDAIASRLLAGLADHAPILLGGDQVAYLDIDDTIRRTYGYHKQGAAYGYNKTKGLNALIATICTPLAAPVITAIRLRRGNVASSHGAPHLIGEGLATARRAGASGSITVRADSANYNHDVVAAARAGDAHFSITARMDPAITAAISRIPEEAWVGIKYPQAIWEESEQRWISDAEVAETPYVAFTSRRKAEHVECRLVVRRVKRLQPNSPDGSTQEELLPAWRYHAFITNSTLSTIEADQRHREHAIIEQVIAELKDGPLAHLPSGSYAANAAWAALATTAFNIARAAAAAAAMSTARWATLRRCIISVPARIASRARHLVLHLPEQWPWQNAWTSLWETATGPPVPAVS